MQRGRTMARRFHLSELILRHATRTEVNDDQDQICEDDYVQAQNPDGSC